MAKISGKSKTATIIIFAFIGLWAVAVGAYLYRQRSKLAPPPPAPSQAMAGDLERWVGIYQAGTKIGYGFSRLRPVPDGFLLWAETRIRILLLNSPQEIFVSIQARLDNQYAIRRVGFELSSSVMSLKADGITEGRELILTLDTAGQKIEQRLPFDEPPSLGREFVMAERLARSQVGDVFSFSEFDPTTQRSILISAKVVAEENLDWNGRSVPCVKAEVTYAGQTEYNWISRSGEILRTVSPATGFEYRAESREQAMNVDWAAAGGVDLASALMVKSSRDLTGPRNAELLKAKLLGAPLEGLDLTAPGRQTFADGVVTIEREQALNGPGYALPLSESDPAQAEQLKEFLSASAFIQSDDPKIRTAAAEARGSGAGAIETSRMLTSWVSANVQDTMVVSVPSAVEVLEKKKGACKEHTVLFVALARALGLPARPVSGIVYMDETAVPGFYYHAWAEVWLPGLDGAGRWFAVDPTFNQFPADATHIKLKEGELREMIELMRVIGRLRVEVEDYR